MSVEQYNLVAHDWLNLEFIINDLANRVIGQELSPGSSPAWAGATFTGKIDIGSQTNPVDVTNTRKYGVELHYFGNDYDVTTLRARAQLVTSDTTATAQGALLQAANNDGIDAGVLNGAVIEAIGKSTANAATISTMRGVLVGTEWDDYDTVTNLKTLHVRTHSRNAAGAGSFGTGYGIYIENEVVGGNGQAYDAGIYFKGTNLSAGNKAFTYGIDFSGGTYGITEIKFSNATELGNSTLKIDNTNYNVRLGTDTFYNDEGVNNVGIGYKAGYKNDTTGAGSEGDYNIYIGAFAGGGQSTTTSTGHTNIAIGVAAMTFLTSGERNVAIGRNALRKLLSGDGNFAIGIGVLAEITTENSNTFIGSSSALSLTGADNVGIGASALQHATSANRHTIIGRAAGLNVSTGDDNIFIGYKSGMHQTTNSDLLIIDNQDRGSATAEITDCLMYGIFHATPASQSLRFNVGSATLGNSTHSDADGGGATQLIFNRQDGAGTETSCARIEGSHDGSGANNQFGKLILSVNTGAGLVQALEIGSDLLATFAGNIVIPNTGYIGSASSLTAMRIAANGEVTFTDVATGILPTAKAHFATREYVDLAIGSSKDYFLSDNDDAVIADYHILYETDTGEAASTLASSSMGQGDDQLMFSYITPSGVPGVTFLRAGIYLLHTHLARTTGTKPTIFYWTLSKYETDTSETVLMTSEESSVIPGSMTLFMTHASLGSDATIDATDRLVLKLYANVEATGSNATITMYMEGENDCHITNLLPSAIWQNQGDVLDDLNTLGAVGADSEFLVGTATGALAWESGATVRTSLGLGTGNSPQFTALTTSSYITCQGNIVGERSFFLLERETPDGNTAGYGQIYVKTVTPNELWFVNDVGTEFQLGVTTDEKVKIDSGATAGYIGAAFNDGVLRTSTPLIYTDGGNFITLSLDAGLTNLATVAMAANKFYYTSADNVHVATTVTSFARSILDDADAATARTTLELDGDAPTNLDSEFDAMLKAHAYLAQTAGFVNAFYEITTTNPLFSYVGSTNDPEGAGTLVSNSLTDNKKPGVFLFVAKGKYFEIVTPGDPTITWTPLITGGDAPIDQD